MEPGRTSKYPMVEVDAAVEIIIESIQPLKAERIDIRQACGRVTYSQILSPENLPRCRTSTMDGYSLLSSDTPGELRLAGTARAGDLEPTLSPGSCIWVTTGGPIPANADTVSIRG